MFCDNSKRSLRIGLIFLGLGIFCSHGFGQFELPTELPIEISIEGFPIEDAPVEEDPSEEPGIEVDDQLPQDPSEGDPASESNEEQAPTEIGFVQYTVLLSSGHPSDGEATDDEVTNSIFSILRAKCPGIFW